MSRCIMCGGHFHLKNSILAQADMDEESRKAMIRSIQHSEKLLTKYEKYIEVEGEL